MPVNLVKGQKISLVKPGSALNRILVGLGWDEVRQRNGLFGLFAGKPADIDCDASVILCGEDGKVVSNRIAESLVYFGNLSHPSGAIRHQGDNLTGSGEGDDEQIQVELSGIPSQIARLVFVVNIYDADKRRQHFGLIRNAFIRIVDQASGRELCRYNLSDDYSGMTGVIVGEMYRSGNEWKFSAVGRGVLEASRLDQLLALYR